MCFSCTQSHKYTHAHTLSQPPVPKSILIVPPENCFRYFEVMFYRHQQWKTSGGRFRLESGLLLTLRCDVEDVCLGSNARKCEVCWPEGSILNVAHFSYPLLTFSIPPRRCGKFKNHTRKYELTLLKFLQFLLFTV